MLIKFIDHSIGNKFWAILTILVVLVLGIYAASQLTIDAVPDITNVQVVVNTKTGALDPEQIEKSVTYPIETEMAGLPRVQEIRSLSKYGLSQVTIVFQDGTNIYQARQWVSERLQNVRGDLPGEIQPQLGPITTGLGEVFMYAVQAKQGSQLEKKSIKEKLIYLRTVQDYIIRPQMKRINGAADVDSNGGYRKEVHINLNIPILNHYGLTIEQLAEKLDSLGKNYGGGYIQYNKKQIIVRTRGIITSLDQIKQIPVKLNFFGVPVKLKDIADIRVDYSQRLGAATYNGEEVVLGTVLMRVGANSRQVALDSEETLKQIKLPDDVAVKILYTRSYLVNATIHTVIKNLLEGAALVIIILLLILGNIRAAILVSLAIPLSMLAAFVGMHFLGISANLMSLGAIDFGLLVDASIVMVENYLHKLEDNSGEEKLSFLERSSLFMESAREVAKPVVIGLLIIMAVYIPILSLDGIEGKMFQPMAITVLMALAASLGVAIMIMPATSILFLRRPKKVSRPWLFRIVEQIYRPVLMFSLKKRWRYLLLGIAVLFMSLSLVLFLRLGSDFVPQLDEGDLVIGLVRDTSIGIDESVRQQKESEKIIRQFKEVELVFSRLGTPESATDPMGVNFADTFVILKKDRSEWTEIDGKVRTKSELFGAIAKAIDEKIPGQEISDTQPIEMRFNEILEGSRADITLRIFGPDLKKLMEYVGKAEAIIKKIPGTSSVEMDALTALTKSPVLDINMDYNKLQYYGINFSTANQILEMAMGGKELGVFNDEEKTFPIIMHLDEKYRDDLRIIGSIPIDLPEGGTLPLRMVSDIQPTQQVTTIARSYAKRYAAISIYIKDRDIASFVAEARAAIAEKLPLPLSYGTEWGGQFKNLEKARERLLIIIPIVLFAIFLLLLRTFNDIMETLLIYLSIPFAMTGGIFSLVLRDIHFSVSAAVGFIALSGIAILNGMVLINKFNQLLRETADIHEAVVSGAISRLRPVLMTALVASLGFIPMAFNTGMGSEVQRPLATVVIGGLITSTLLTLLMIPMLFYWVKGWKEKSAKNSN